jgi:pectin methylesterase-like acyl-CoA thioesterase
LASAGVVEKQSVGTSAGKDACATGVVLACLLLVLPGLVQAATRYVGACGAPSTPTLAAALTAASSGDSILVCPGTYNEAVTVNKDGLTLRSSTGNRADVTLAHNNTPLTLTGLGITVRDLTVTSNNGTAINQIGRAHV